MGQNQDTALGQDHENPVVERPDFWRRPNTGRLALLRDGLSAIGESVTGMPKKLAAALKRAPARPQPKPQPQPSAPGAPVVNGAGAVALPAPPPGPAPAPAPGTMAEAAPLALNPLVRTATPLLALMSRLPTLPPPANLDGLRHRITAALRRFQSAARAGGVTADQMRAAHFILCTAVDDIICHTDWGRDANWSERGLIRTFHKTIDPNRGLVTMLDYMLTEPQRHICELELICLCMALGFEGRYRVLDDGPPAFRHVRDQLYRAITSVRGEPAAELSPEWRPAAPIPRPLATRIPLWVAACLVGAVFAGFYVVLTLSIGGHADRVFQKLAILLPDRPAVIAHFEPASGSGVPTEAAPTAGSQLSARAKRYQTALGAESAAGMIEVVTDRDIDVLRVSGANAFVRGGEILTRAGHQLIERLAVLLDREPGRLLVIGHADDHPALSIRLPSALALSEARARAVARVLVAHLTLPERVDIEGRGDTEPLVSNTSPANRDRNRRVEIILPHGETRRQ